MDISDATALRARFVEGYRTPDGLHPLEHYQSYELVMEHRAAKPKVGAKLLSDRLGLPTGRIQAWLSGGQPNGYEAMQEAESLGWFDLDWQGEHFSGLNRLVAQVLSGGSISATYTPVFSVDAVTAKLVSDALDAAGIQEYEHIQADSGRSEEIRPREYQGRLGRMLITLGAPQGEKAHQSFGVPPYLSQAPRKRRQEFVSIYLANRAVDQSRYELLVVREERDMFYLEQLAALFRTVLDIEVNITEYNIQLWTSVEELTEMLPDEYGKSFREVINTDGRKKR